MILYLDGTPAVQCDTCYTRTKLTPDTREEVQRWQRVLTEGVLEAKDYCPMHRLAILGRRQKLGSISLARSQAQRDQDTT